MKKSRDCIPSAPFDDIPLYFCDSPTTESTLVELKRLIAGSTHVVSWPIASRTDWVNSSNRLSFLPRSRALQMSAQDNPSSTQPNSLAIESWLRVNLWHLMAEEDSTYPDHREDADGAKDGLCWCDTRDRGLRWPDSTRREHYPAPSADGAWYP